MSVNTRKEYVLSMRLFKDSLETVMGSVGVGQHHTIKDFIRALEKNPQQAIYGEIVTDGSNLLEMKEIVTGDTNEQQ